MLKARLTTAEPSNHSSLISPEEYKESTHEHHLLCPDSECSAKLAFRNASETSEACFTTKKGQEHRQGCNAFIYEYMCHTAVESITNNRDVLFRFDLFSPKLINIFNGKYAQSKPLPDVVPQGLWSTQHVGHRAIPVHSLEKLCLTIDHIDAQFGQDGLNQLFFQGGFFVGPHNVVDLRGNADKVEELFKTRVHQARAVYNKSAARPSFFPQILSVESISQPANDHGLAHFTGSEQMIQTNIGERPISSCILTEDNSTLKQLTDAQNCCVLTHAQVPDFETVQKSIHEGKSSQLALKVFTSRQIFTYSS